MMNIPPEIIRVKRRRDEDSIQALLLEEDKRLIKKGKFIFKLTNGVNIKMNNLTTSLIKLKDTNDKIFLLKGQEVSMEISEMLDEYLEQNSINSNRSFKSKEKILDTNYTTDPYIHIASNDDYVYDIYIRETLPEDEFVFNKNTMGYIRIVDDIDHLIPIDDPENVEDSHFSDNEDSNDEDYYKNDYPENEDDDRSILFGTDDDKSEDDKYNNKLHEYDQLFQKLENNRDLLSSININTYMDSYLDDQLDDIITQENDSYMDDNSDDDDFQRHTFFPNDEDDPISTYRDKIFSKLQRMINK